MRTVAYYTQDWVYIFTTDRLTGYDSKKLTLLQKDKSHRSDGVWESFGLLSQISLAEKSQVIVTLEKLKCSVKINSHPWQLRGIEPIQEVKGHTLDPENLPKMRGVYFMISLSCGISEVVPTCSPPFLFPYHWVISRNQRFAVWTW